MWRRKATVRVYIHVKHSEVQISKKMRMSNPENKPMPLQWIAETLWPDAAWLNNRPGHGLGGARTGARVASGLAARMEKAGMLRLCTDKDVRRYVLAASEK